MKRLIKSTLIFTYIMDNATVERIITYLVDISNQNYTLKEEHVVEEKDPKTQLILAGILNLEEDLKFLEQEHIKSMSQLVHKSELERINAELNNFAYITSHDLKAPLRGISNLAQWLSADYKDILDAQGQEYLGLMVSKVKRMEQLIEDILDYSKIGKREELLANIDLKKLANETIESLTFPESFIFLVADLPIIKAVRSEWNQVMSNLISNAIKYNDKDKGILKIFSKNIDEKIVLIFEDNGPGIAAKHQEKVFELFQTLNPDAANSNSTGVGLSTVKKIIEINKGSINIDSVLGESTRFTIKLPANLLVDEL
ncbi:MAG: ATP-binding protein [Crocinitomicaceae bacterium]